tara:strand:+ start:1044 stop:2489 length:1446 start_codon:yes stop_codon:yes gene_type:complete
MTRWVWVLGCVLALGCSMALGCGDDDGDSAGPGDGGPVDGGGADASTPDASGLDAGEVDAFVPGPECPLPAPFDEGVVYERTLHVAADAPSGGDGSVGAPFGSIAAAVAAATPGTEVRIAEGTYPSLTLGPVTGEPGRPIAVVGEGMVRIDGGGSSTGLEMSDASYVVLQNLTVVNAGVHGMNLDDGGTFDTPAHHLVLRDITVVDAGSGGNEDCIKMSGIDDFWILGGTLRGCNRGEAIDMVGCHRGLIQSVNVVEPVANGIQTKGGSSEVTIHACRFVRVPGRAVNAGGSTGLDFFRPQDAPHEAADIRVLASVFEDVGEDSGAPIAFVGCDGCTFAHNTILRPRTWVARILQESTEERFAPSRDGLFADNLIVLDTADLRTYLNVGGNTAPETFTFDHNLWWALDQDADWAGPTLGGGVPAETDSLVQQDPQLDDEHVPAPTSPAVGAGRTLGLDPVPDHVGRCFATPPTIGAFEVAE